MKNITKALLIICIVFTSLWNTLTVVSAEEISLPAFKKMQYEHQRFLSTIKKDTLLEAYKSSHVAFINYLQAEKANLAIFNENIEYKGEILQIYVENLEAILKQREREISSLLNNDSKWRSQPFRKNLMRSFKAVNQRVPYDRGEPLRPSFRMVDKTWHIFLEKEKKLYAILSNQNINIINTSMNVLYEARTKNLYQEYKGVIAIKIEKED